MNKIVKTTILIYTPIIIIEVNNNIYIVDIVHVFYRFSFSSSTIRNIDKVR